MIKLIVIFFAILYSINVNAQILDWVKTTGSSANDIGLDVVTDSLGNVYTTGYFSDTVDFDPGAGTMNLISAGLYDVFIQKLDSSGNLVWAKNVGGAAFDIGQAITVDKLGNVYVTGSFRGTADFDPSAGVLNFVSEGGEDAFVLKLDNSGNLVWAKAFGGDYFGETGRSLAVDDFGNVYTTGYFSDTVDFDPGVGVHILVSYFYSNDAFVQKLDSNGDFVWAKTWGGIGIEIGASLVLDRNGDIYITGEYQDTVDFDPGGGVYELTDGSTYIQKLDGNGNFIWAKSFGGIGGGASSMTLDSLNNIYITGDFIDTADFDPGSATYNLISNGSKDIYVQKLDENGNFIWAKSFGGTTSDLGHSIAVDVLGNVYTTGTFQGTVDFDPNVGIDSITSNGSKDIYIQKLDENGNFIWASGIGGSNYDKGSSIVVDFNNIYVVGLFEGTVDFEPGSGITNIASNAGSYDVFLLKLITNTVGFDLINSKVKKINVFPNPAFSSITIEREGIEIEQISIFDAGGRVYTILDGSKDKIDVSNLTAGIYFLQFKTKDGIAYGKFVKQ